MKIPNTQILNKVDFDRLIIQARQMNWDLHYQQKKHQLEILYKNNWLAKVFLPWDQEWLDLKLCRIEDFQLALVGIKAGQAFTGLFQHDELVDHKVFRAYMVRKKQGKSQIKHLKTKGKSRAGSRIRLAETERFFREINERLQIYDNLHPISRWGISCSKTLWPHLFSSEIAPPFESKDSKVLSLPFHIQKASYEELQECYGLLRKFHLLISENGASAFSEFFDKNEEDISDEDW